MINVVYTEEMVQEAYLFAKEKHANQTYGDTHYLEHLRQVHELAVVFSLPIEYRIAAFLHDCLEDTDTTFEEIEIKFGTHVANLVNAVSGYGVNRKERTEDTLRKLSLYPQAINLKMIDRLANSKNSKKNRPKLFTTYQKEHALFLNLFKQGNEFILSQLEKVLDINIMDKNDENKMSSIKHKM